MALAAAIEPLEHQAMHGMVKLAQRRAVVGHAKVVEIPRSLPAIARQRSGVVYGNCAANSDQLQTRYDQLLDHLSGGADHAI